LLELLFCPSDNDEACSQQQAADHGGGDKNEPIRASHLIAPPITFPVDLSRSSTTASVNHFTQPFEQLRVILTAGNGLKSTWGTAMQRRLKLAGQLSRTGKLSLSHWAFAVHTTMALIVIVLVALTLSELEVSLSGDESLSALEAAMATRAITGPTK